MEAFAGLVRTIRTALYLVVAVACAALLILAGMAARLYLPAWVLAAAFFGVVAVVLAALWVAWARHDEVTL
jgi:hypothetical protein